MQKISWDKFKVKNEDYRKSFEELSYFLFCRSHKISSGIYRYQNQTGIETEPIKVNRKLVGFQAKWFDTTIDKGKINSSITKAKGKNPKLNKIILYINQEFSESTKKSKKESQIKIDIENHAKKEKIDIEWVLPSNFEVILNQPSNLDLAQLYFDFSDEFGFIKSFSNPETLTFLQSSEYIELPFFCLKTQKVEEITKRTLKLKQKTFLLSGHPGSGKSISMYRIFQILAGLDKGSIEDSKQVLQKNKAIPMLINLKSCAFETIENVIRERQKDFGLGNNKLGFIYLLDGLDELSGERADQVLAYLYELERSEKTFKIIISCRSGNLNRVKVKTYFTDIAEYKIHDLSEDHINRYFIGKNNLSKRKLLSILIRQNKTLCCDIRDILLVKLLWDTIESLNVHSTIIDLLDKKFELLVNEPQYKKNIEELNLLNPKEDKIIELNKEISFKFQKRFQFRLAQEDVQQIILSKYPRIDYKAANEILNYIANLFFDSSPSSSKEQDGSTYVYQHRRYQDYFFIQYLADIYEENPKIIRELSVLSNRDFFENLFLPYLRGKYKRDRNLPGILELNLFDVYLGNRNDYGADDPYYQNSSDFIPSLAIQNKAVIDGLLSDESLAIREKISINLDEVKNKFVLWDKDKENWRLRDYLIGIWNGGISYLIQNIAIFLSYGKKEEIKELISAVNEISELYEKYKFKENLKENDRLNNPFWARWEDHLYIKIVLKKEKPKDIFTKLIRANYKSFVKERYTIGSQEAGKDKLVKSFFRAIIRVNNGYLLEIINELDEEEMLMLLDVLVSEQYLPILIRNKAISEKIKAKIADIKADKLKLIFCKKVFYLTITEEEKKFVEQTLKDLREKRQVDWHMYRTHEEYSMAAYVIDEITFEKYLKPQEGHPFRYYNELGLYAALFRSYIELLRNERNLESIARDYIRFVNFYYETAGGKYLKADMSFLWADIFAYSKTDIDKLRNVKKSLVTKENNLVPFSFYINLLRIDDNQFVKLISRTELQVFENYLDNWDDDAPSFVNHCFQLASFFARIDEQKAINYIARGINEGMVRHGWHKDIIVSHFLIDALEILWRNNWVSIDELRALAKRVYELTKKVKQITDGDHTSRGPYTLLDMVSKYDLDFAIELKADIDKNYSERRYSSNVTLSSILRGKVSRGYPIEEIEEEIKHYRKDYRYDGKPDADYYEHKFEIYLAISQSDFYSSEERKMAFENAYQQVEEMKKVELDYYLSDLDYKNSKKVFIKLCKKYGKKVNVKFENKEEYKTKYKLSEKQFTKELKKARTRQKMAVLLKQVNDQVKLVNPKSWNLLVEKTYKIYKNINPFIELLRENSFPHTDWFRTNSQYFYFGLASALNNVNTREEAINYLFDKTTGHGGFINVMKSYEFIGERDICIKLFRRFIRICDFLVN